jgi:hypothetical protein
MVVAADGINALLTCIDTQLPELQTGAVTTIARIAISRAITLSFPCSSVLTSRLPSALCVEKMAGQGVLQVLAMLCVQPDPRVQAAAAAALANIALFGTCGGFNVVDESVTGQ